MGSNIGTKNTLDISKALIQALQNPSLYPHQVKAFQIFETHISWVILTGTYAYKIKKPVHFDFVDFSTLEKRHFYCLEEFRLNQSLSKELYIEVVPIFGQAEAPSLLNISGKSAIIEYAVKMHQFEQTELLSQIIKNIPKNSPSKELENIVKNLANQMAAFHRKAKKTSENSPFGSKAKLLSYLKDNFMTLKNKVLPETLLKKIDRIEIWSYKTLEQYSNLFEARKKEGYIRECHGDLHLNNIIYQNRKVIIFDCIEFNEDFRNIDCIDEIAFLMMDLKAEDAFIAAYQLLNQYLRKTDDYTGLPLLRFYEVYRAMVRAKVALLTLMNTIDTMDTNIGSANFSPVERYLDLALKIIKPHPSSAFLIITYGLPGSGKSYLSHNIASSLSAIHLQSDVERKHLFNNLSKELLYSTENKDKVYQHLTRVATMLLKAEIPVIVDASFVSYAQRQLFYQLSREQRVPFVILNCAVDFEILRRRIKNREERRTYSDADLVVLDKLILQQEGLSKDEEIFTINPPMDKDKNLEAQYSITQVLALILSRIRG